MGELIGVVERGGVYVPEADLWLDPRRAKGRAFVSHAHADHYAGHGEVLCSEGTGELVEARFRRKRGRVVVAKGWGERFPVAPGYVAALYPAGHIVGSAMLWLGREADGASFLYTGDFKLRAGLSAEVCEVPRAEVVVMETTFGLPRYRFPEAEGVWERVRGFVRESHADGVLPVLMAYSLGKAQEVLCALEGNGWDVVVHRAVGEMTAVCAGLRPGVVWPGYRVIGKGGVGVGKRVLVVPPGGKWKGAVELEGVELRRAMVTGWGLDRSAKYRYGVDEVFPISDHGDFDELLAFVEEVAPERVYTVHGYAREFAATLRERGVEAWTLGGTDQLELGLG